MQVNGKKIEIDTTELKRYGNAFDVAERKELIAEMLQLLRQQSELTQSEVANYIGIKAGTYSTYENGTREAPAEIIVRLSKLYNIPTDMILQVERVDKSDFVTKKQFEDFKSDIDELREIAFDKDNQLNSEMSELLKNLTDVFSNVGDAIKELSDNAKSSQK